MDVPGNVPTLQDTFELPVLVTVELAKTEKLTASPKLMGAVVCAKALFAAAPAKRVVAMKNLDNFMVVWFDFLNYGYFSLLLVAINSYLYNPIKCNFISVAADEVIVGRRKGKSKLFTNLLL